jgi:acyl dehydratase
MSVLFDDVAVGDAVPTLLVKIRARHVVMGASSSRDWQPQHHDTHWAVERVKVKDIFLNTPNQAGWIERYLTDWTGPNGRLGKIRFKMKASVCAGDVLTFNATVTDKAKDERGVGWVDLDLRLTIQGDVLATECTARIAVPTAEDDDPWLRRGDDWRP